MRPKIFNRHFVPLAVFPQSPQPHALLKAVRNVGVQFCRYLSAASLRLDDNRQGNPFAVCVRLRDSDLLPAAL
jgi:hypothetical protein